MSATQYVEESLIRHQIFLQRYAGSTTRQIRSALADLVESVNAVLTAPAPTDDQLIRAARIRELLAPLGATLGTQEFVDAHVAELAAYEVDFIARLYGSAMTVDLAAASSELAIASATSIPVELISGDNVTRMTIRELVQQFDDSAIRTITSRLQAGIVRGDSLDSLSKQVQALSKSKLLRDAEALTRTVNNHVGSVAREVFYAANSDVIKEERFVATLDSRTTLTCAGFDGKSFAIGRGPRPPLHYRCRSIRVAMIADKFGIDQLAGQRPQKGSAGPGTTSAKTTFNSFFNRQSEAWRKEYLGPKRYELYKKGRLNIDKFTDDLGRPLTIDELVDREGLVFGD